MLIPFCLVNKCPISIFFFDRKMPTQQRIGSHCYTFVYIDHAQFRIEPLSDIVQKFYRKKKKNRSFERVYVLSEMQRQLI